MQITVNMEEVTSATRKREMSLYFAFGITSESIPFNSAIGIDSSNSNNLTDLIATRAKEIVTGLGYGKDLVYKSCIKTGRSIVTTFDVTGEEKSVDVTLKE